MRPLSFTEVGRQKGRYRRRIYDAKIMNCDRIGKVEWFHGAWCLRPHDEYSRLDTDLMEQVLAFMERLPIYRSGKAVKRDGRKWKLRFYENNPLVESVKLIGAPEAKP